MVDFDPAKAGHGEHEYVFRAGDQPDSDSLLAGRDYLAVDAVGWYVNRSEPFWKDRIVSGTAKVTIGDEIFEVALGTYDLGQGAHVAPFFEATLVPPKAYRGGPVAIHVVVKGIEDDNMIGSLFRGVASASLGVVKSSIDLATVAGPLSVLKAAGTSLVGGVEQALADGKGSVTVFNKDGFGTGIPDDKIAGPETYLLLHRGNWRLDSQRLKLGDVAGKTSVLLDGVRVEDGAWVLFRIRRTRVYGSLRPWDTEARAVKTDLDGLMARWRTGRAKIEDVERELLTTDIDKPTIGDRVFSVYTTISNDGALVEAEARSFAYAVVGLLEAAKAALDAKDPTKYTPLRSSLAKSLAEGIQPADRAFATLPGLIEVRGVGGLESIATARGAAIAPTPSRFLDDA